MGLGSRKGLGGVPGISVEVPAQTAIFPGSLGGPGGPPAQPTPGRATGLAPVLVEAGLLSQHQAARAWEVARRERVPLGSVLVRDGLVLSRDLAALTALYLGITMVDLRGQTIDPEAVALLPEAAARRYIALPLSKQGDYLTVAIADPSDLGTLQDLTARTGSFIEPVIATHEDILAHIDLVYRLNEGLRTRPGQVGSTGGEVPGQRLEDAPPAELVDLLIRQALQDRASDVHLEPAEKAIRVRFRIDGILHDVASVPPATHPMLISRLKIASGMNIAERRRPQDGQLTFELNNRQVDVRVAVSGTADGEMAVLRLLDKKLTLLGLDQLGMGTQALESYRRLMRLPYGMIIVCGPTGAGKSTTLYASILQIDRKEQNVISLEDPVEYRIHDVNQMQVQAEAGITFATQLRSILRLDPDVILVGEIRDQETAVIATQAALTGHLVLTSLHANDAVSALLRLRDLGVAPYPIASSVAGIAAQRMVRMVCSGCRELVVGPVADQAAYSSEMGEAQQRFAYGSGCNMCAHTGYLGRAGVFELLTMSDSLRQMFLDQPSRHMLWEQALREGMTPMRREGMLKVKEGTTTPYEVMRILFSLD